MHRAIKPLPLSGAITVLQDDEPEAASAAVDLPAPIQDFEAQPYAVASSHPMFAHLRPRVVDDARDWSVCRAQRLRLEEQLALQEEFRLVDAERAGAIRGELSRIERHVGEVPVERVIAGLTAVAHMLHDDGDEHEWW